jgi:xanthine dehydrogenase molybdenum-binding subunit
MELRTCGLSDCMATATRSAGWEKKRPKPKQEGRKALGIGMASLFHVGGGAKIYRSDGCGTMIKLDDFGGATVFTGSSEIGQGSETMLAIIVSQELGLPLENIRIVNNDTELTPWDVGVHASRTTFIAGNSALYAAREARVKLLRAAAEKLERKPGDLDLERGKVIDRKTGEPLESIGKILRGIHFGVMKNDLVMTSYFYEPPSKPPDKEDKGDISASYSFGTHVAEVEVDLDTGVVKVLRLCAAHDVGRVINQLSIEGQVEGGVAQGMGYALTEEVKVEGGHVLNPSFTDYKIMTTTDLPELKIAFVETHDPAGPYGAKGIGESPLIPVAAAVANAVYHATGARVTRLPLTPERVLRAIEKTRQEGGASQHG